MDLNKAMIIGRLTRDPELRTVPSGIPVANFDIATNRIYTDQSGAKRETVEFHSIVMWRRLAEIASQYLRKGSKAYIEGRLQTRSWDDPNGFKRYKTEIVADNMIMLDRPPIASSTSYQPISAQAAARPPAFTSGALQADQVSGFANDAARPAPAWDSQPPISESQPIQPSPAKITPQDPEENIPTIDISEDESLTDQKDEEVSVEDIPF